MGQEAKCTVRWERKTSTGTALLETEELLFRGDFRLRIPFKEMNSLRAVDGELRVTFAEGTAAFELGPLAAKWLEKIKHPKSLIDKLGVRATSCVTVLSVEDASFLRQLRERAADVSVGKPCAACDFAFLGVDSPAGLKRLASLTRVIATQGAIWVVWPKGREKIKEDHVRVAALRVGLVDVKVVAFSPTHSALKLVIPLARR
jgi:hypothetical protein